MAYRNKTYICFDGDEDINYYRLMTAWKANDKIDFNFHDAHDLRNSRDSSCEATIKRSLRERLKNSKLFLVLVGEKTKNLYKFVRWEMDVALELEIPIIVVNLNGKREIDNTLCPPILRNELAIHVYFNKTIIQHAIDNWIEQSKQYTTGPYRYTATTYKQLGL